MSNFLICRDANAYTLASLHVCNGTKKVCDKLFQICRDANAYAFASLRFCNGTKKVCDKLLQICRDANAYAFASLHVCNGTKWFSATFCTFAAICQALDCQLGDVLEYVKK